MLPEPAVSAIPPLPQKPVSPFGLEADKLARHSAFISDDVPPNALLAEHLGRAELRRALYSGVRAVLERDATGPEIMGAIKGAAAGLIVLRSEDTDALLLADMEVNCRCLSRRSGLRCW